MRYLLLFVMATLTAVGQSTKPAPDPPLCLMKKGDYYVACPKPKKHKAPVKSAPSGTIDDTRNEGDGPHTMCTDGKVTKFGDDCNKPVDDGVAHWQAPKPPVPEAIKEGTICDNLPETQKITCLMNLKCLHDAMVASPNTTEFPQCACLVDGPTAVPEATTVQNSPINYGVTAPEAITIYIQDGYDCTMGRTFKTITINCTLKEPK